MLTQHALLLHVYSTYKQITSYTCSMFCIFYRPPQLVDLFFWGSTSNHAVALSNSANGRQLPFHAPCMPQPKLSQCSANVHGAYAKPMPSQCPAYMLSQCPCSLCSANAQPMLSQCQANSHLPELLSLCAQPMLTKMPS